MTDKRDAFEYEVAVSFAEADRATADELVDLLSRRKITVLRDQYTSYEHWGNDVVDHLVNLYARKARYCVLLLSQHYPLKQWTESERTAATERSLREAEEYILPVLLDDGPVLRDTDQVFDLHQHSLETMVDLLEQKLAASKSRSGPPSQSHDLRSGNVPSDPDRPD